MKPSWLVILITLSAVLYLFAGRPKHVLRVAAINSAAKIRTAPAKVFPEQPKALAMSARDVKAWEPSGYAVVKDTLPGIIALKNGSKLVYGASSEIRLGRCGAGFCLTFPNHQEVVVGEALEKALPTNLRWQLHDHSWSNRDSYERNLATTVSR